MFAQTEAGALQCEDAIDPDDEQPLEAIRMHRLRWAP